MAKTDCRDDHDQDGREQGSVHSPYFLYGILAFSLAGYWRELSENRAAACHCPR